LFEGKVPLFNETPHHEMGGDIVSHSYPQNTIEMNG
jgi:hypothetical protein